MSIFDKIKSVTYDRNRNKIFGLKSAIVWGNSKDTNSIFPLLYISKPKHISKEDFDILLSHLEISFKQKQ
jgi:hypothetical protein